jgi:hypothetical protein
MDSGKGRKRPWEVGSPIESEHKRRNSSAAAAFERIPPHPQHAGDCSSTSEALARRTLPPLYTTPSLTASAGFVPTNSTQTTSKPRSQSLFDVPLQAARQRSEGDQSETISCLSYFLHWHAGCVRSARAAICTEWCEACLKRP